MILFRKNEKEPVSDSDDDDDDDAITPRHNNVDRDDILIIATHGKIYAVRKQDGSRLWRQKFPTGAGGGVVSLFITDQNTLIVAATGKTASMDLFTGQTLWVNQMKGCGYHEVGVVVTPSQIMQPQRHHRQNTEEGDGHHSPPEYTASSCSEELPQIVIACTDGKCMGIDMATGEALWLFKCPKGGFKLSTALLDPRVEDSGRRVSVYVGCGTMLYCLDARSGQVAWSTRISNSRTGFDYLTMASAWSSRCAAEAHTGFNQFPAAQQEHAIRTRRYGFPTAVTSSHASSSAPTSEPPDAG